MTPQQIFDSLIIDTLRPIFKEISFRASGHCFSQDYENFTKLFEIQKSRFNSAESVDFTFNIGIYDKLSAREVNDNVIAKSPKPHDCILAKRIGRLIPGGKDIWYKIEVATNKDIIERQVLDDILQYVLPYLDSFKSATDLLQAYRTESDPYIKSKGTDLYVAIHLLHENRFDEATKILNELKMKWIDNSFWHGKIDNILEKYQKPL